jgi:hypothetical protein
LVGEVVALDPCVEADFADGSLGVLEEEGFEEGFPIWRTARGLPWVDAEGWEEGGVLAAEGSDAGPVIRVGAIDDGGGDAGGGQLAEEVFAPRVESAIVEVVVGVAPHGAGSGEGGGEFADAGCEGGHAVESGGRDHAVEAEACDDGGVVGGGGGWGCVLIYCADESGEAADDGGVSVP